jgi:putative N6-adenine-specific DNA methylase
VCTISVDAAGAALHRRGYRQALAKAPLRETLAAAMLLGAEWNGSTALCDPFCGSGTIAIEAALLARGVPPGLHRSFAAERWPSADASLWREVRSRAASVVGDALLPPIVGSDRDAGAVEAARANAERAGVGGDIEFAIASVSAVHAPAAAGLLVTNPPYGVRTGDTATLRNLHARFGAVARREFAGWRAAVLSADRTRGHVLERQLGLRLAPAWRSVNGGIPVRLLVGEIPS